MPCNHIIGAARGSDEFWLVQLEDAEKDKDYMEIYFAFCPICGEKLDFKREENR